MNKTTKLLAVISALAIGFVFTNACAAGPMDRGHVSEWIGTSVTNAQGDELGRIDDFVFDQDRIAFVVLSCDEPFRVLGIAYDDYYRGTEKLVAVPTSALSYFSGQEKVVLDISMERLKSAPAFDKNALADRRNAEE